MRHRADRHVHAAVRAADRVPGHQPPVQLLFQGVPADRARRLPDSDDLADRVRVPDAHRHAGTFRRRVPSAARPLAVHVRPGPRLRRGHHRVRRAVQHHQVLGGARAEVPARRRPVRVPGVPERAAQRQGVHIHLHTLDVPGHHVLHTVRLAGRAQRRHLQPGERVTDYRTTISVAIILYRSTIIFSTQLTKRQYHNIVTLEIRYVLIFDESFFFLYDA